MTQCNAIKKLTSNHKEPRVSTSICRFISAVSRIPGTHTAGCGCVDIAANSPRQPNSNADTEITKTNALKWLQSGQLCTAQPAKQSQTKELQGKSRAQASNPSQKDGILGKKICHLENQRFSFHPRFFGCLEFLLQRFHRA